MPCTLGLMPIPDLSDATENERVALAVETAYVRMIAGTIRTKGLPPEQLALILCRIADNLLDRG